MGSVHEQLSEQFYKWESRGRGWQVFDEPVSPEPPFQPFRGYRLFDPAVVDDGRVPTLLSSLFRKISQPQPKPVIAEEPEPDPEPTPLVRESLVELQASLPNKLDVSQNAFEQFLLNLSECREPIAFELIGQHKQVTAQFAAASKDAPLVHRQLQAHFPEAVFIPVENRLESALNATTGDEILTVEFGLEREFMWPLRSNDLDPFIGIIGALAELKSGELGLFQILWQPVQNPWAESIVNSVTLPDGKPLFVNASELAGAAENKASQTIYAVVVRVMVCAETYERMVQLASDLAGSLRVFDHPNGNALIPLHNDDYPFVDHINDVLRRQTRRTGMLLNSDELAGFVHLPSSAVRSPVFQRQTTKSKAAPAIVCNESGLLLGSNEHAGKIVSVRLTPEQRVHHTHIIGASGTGKSTLLFNLIHQSIQNNEGIAVLDPHGDLIERILGVIPESRIKDVILIDPVDEEYAVGFNILSAHSNLEKNLLASDLVAVFQRLSTSWGDQMNSVLQNAILAFLESDRGGTIVDLQRFLTEKAYRNEFLKTVKNSQVRYYWEKTFTQLVGNRSIGSILTRLDTLLAQTPILHMVSQPQNNLDFAQIMDSGKILLAKLPEGLLGRENSHLLGTLLVSKFQQIVMSRQAQRIESRRMFNLFIDEFANFITPSMAEILSGARKYRIGLTLAHHELHQLQRSPEVASAVMTHPFTRIVFRVGDDDARKLAEGFSYFESQDLRNLETGQAICRVERSDFDFNLEVPLPEMPNEEAAAQRRQEVITASRKTYSVARAEVEAMLAKAREAVVPVPTIKTEPTVKPVVEPTKAAEVPKVTVPSPVMEMPGPVVAAIPKPKVETPAVRHEPPRDLGRGGAQHQAVQKRIKEAAEALGFRSVIEKPVLDGQGSVDLWLERADQSIACEISISTTIDHEVKNVAKCLKAGVPKVAVICLDEERLRKISNAVSGSFGTEAVAQVEYFQPDQFIAHLKTIPMEIAKEKVTVRRGYKIKRVISEISTEQQKEKEAAAIRSIADSMRKK
ncbi:MAG: type IV secretion system DNA-binding domain-containing protein [Verrucomicrobiae bacterium]